MTWLKSLGFFCYPESIGEKLFKNVDVFCDNLMIELGPSAQPISGYDEEKANNHIYSSLIDIKIPLCLAFLYSFVYLVHDGYLIMNRADFLEIGGVDEDGGASNVRDCFIGF